MPVSVDVEEAPQAAPKASFLSATPGTPGVFWCRTWLPVPVTPDAVPCSRAIEPASVRPLKSSPLIPGAISARPSPVTSATETQGRVTALLGAVEAGQALVAGLRAGGGRAGGRAVRNRDLAGLFVVTGHHVAVSVAIHVTHADGSPDTGRGSLLEPRTTAEQDLVVPLTVTGVRHTLHTPKWPGACSRR